MNARSLIKTKCNRLCEIIAAEETTTRDYFLLSRSRWRVGSVTIRSSSPLRHFHPPWQSFNVSRMRWLSLRIPASLIVPLAFADPRWSSLFLVTPVDDSFSFCGDRTTTCALSRPTRLPLRPIDPSNTLFNGAGDSSISPWNASLASGTRLSEL